MGRFTEQLKAAKKKAKAERELAKYREYMNWRSWKRSARSDEPYDESIKYIPEKAGKRASRQAKERADLLRLGLRRDRTYGIVPVEGRVSRGKVRVGEG